MKKKGADIFTLCLLLLHIILCLLLIYIGNSFNMKYPDTKSWLRHWPKGQALRAREISTRVCRFAWTLRALLPFGIGITTSFGDCASAYSGRPVPRPRCRLNEPRAPAERQARPRRGRPMTGLWSVVCGWSTRSAAGLPVRAARRSSAVTVVR